MSVFLIMVGFCEREGSSSHDFLGAPIQKLKKLEGELGLHL